MNFNKWGGCPSEINLKMQRKMPVLCLLFRYFSAFRLNFELFFLRIFLLVWHLWQQKNNIAVGMRARTRVRERKVQRCSVLSSTLRKTRVQKNILSLFPWFFPLGGYIDPYIFRDAIKLCAPNLQFHFHGESQSNILNPNRLLDRYCAICCREYNFLPSFIFLLASCCSFVLDVTRYAFELTINHLLNNPMKSVLELMTEWG